MAKSDYGRQMLKQMEEMMKKCDGLTCESKEAKSEIKRLNKKG